MTLKEIFLPWLVVREQRRLIEKLNRDVFVLEMEILVKARYWQKQPRDNRGRFAKRGAA